MLGEVLNYEQPNKYIVESTTYDDSYKIPVLTAGQSFVLGYTNETENIYDNLPCIIFDDFTTSIQYVDFPFKVKSSAMKILTTDVNENDIRYLYYRLSIIKVDTGLHKRYWISRFAPMHIEIPELKEQRKIANILDKISALITERKKQIENLDLLVKSQFVEMFGDPVVNPMGWNIKPLSEVITYANNGMARRGNDENGNIVLRLVELQDGYIDYAKPNRIKLDEAEKERYLLIDGDFLFARVNGNSENVGRCAVFEGIGESVYHNDHIIRVRFNHKVLDGVFASKLLNSDYGKGEMRNKIKTSAGQYTINQAGIGATKTPLPPLPLQNSFADFVRQTDKSKFEIQQGLERLELQYNALMQQYFG